MLRILDFLGLLPLTVPVKRPDLYGDGHSAERITHVLGGGQLDESDVHSDSMRSMSN